LTVPLGQILENIRTFATHVPEKGQLREYLSDAVGVTTDGKVVINVDGEIKHYGVRAFNRFRTPDQYVTFYDASPVQMPLATFLRKVKEEFPLVRI
jgi:hypothetical protein